MKKLILFLLIFSPEFAKACAKKIDTSKVMLFIDTNNSELEIETTEKAACARGERLVIVPKNYKEFGKYSKPAEEASKKITKLKCWSQPNGPGCQKATDELNQAHLKLSVFKSAQKPTSAGVKEALEEIKSSKGKLQNISISGHDGGGSFSGSKGSYSRQELAGVMKDFGDINEVKSLMLLGCYTGTQHEVIQWKSIFPQTKIIGGYDGSAPLADRPQGHKYITDILTKEKQLTSQADQKKLQAYVDANLKGLGNLQAALFLQCSDGSTTHDYYYGSKKSKKIEKFDIKECLEKKDELTAISEEINKYSSGAIEPPTDTQNGALRVLYNKARALEHCAELVGVLVDVNAVFNLLFYAGVKETFAKYYQDDLLKAQEIIDGIDPLELEKTFRENMALREKAIAEEDASIALMESNPTEYFAQQEKEVEALKAKTDALLNDPKNADMRVHFNQMSSPGLGGMMGMAINFSNQDEIARFNAISAIHSQYSAKKALLAYQKADPKESLEVRKDQSSATKLGLVMQEQAFRDFKEKLKDPKNKIWIPTAENLKKYSRAELMENSHRMNQYLAAGGLSSKQSGALRWVNSVQMTHLQAFQNPFSWHEYTGHIEKPPYSIKLSDYLKSSDGNRVSIGFQGGVGGGGYPGGFGGGGYPMGGFGGMVGGANGSGGSMGGGGPALNPPPTEETPE